MEKINIKPIRTKLTESYREEVANEYLKKD